MLREQTELSKVRALDEDLIKNSLRKVEAETLEYFESNPMVFENALQKLDEELLNIGPVQRVAYSSRYLDNLAAAGKKLDNPTEKVEVLAHHGDDVTSASGSTGRSEGPNDVKGRDADKTKPNKGGDIDQNQLQKQDKKSNLDERSLDDVNKQGGEAGAKGKNIQPDIYKVDTEKIINDKEIFPSIQKTGGSDDVIFDSHKLERLRVSLEKQGVSVWIGEDAERFLKQMGAEAMYWDNLPGKPGTLILPRKPTRAQVIEELKHLGQHRKRQWKEAGGYENIVKIEIETQKELLEFASKKQWNAGEIKKLQDALEYWEKELQELNKLK